MRKWKISVQRLGPDRRWREVSSWSVLTIEPDQQGLLNVGIKENWRIIVREEARTPASSPSVC